MTEYLQQQRTGGFSKPVHTSNTPAYLQELLTTGVAEVAHSNPVQRNSKPSLRQLKHSSAQGKRAERKGKNWEKTSMNNQNVTTCLIPPFIPLTPYCSERTVVQEQPKMWVFKNKMLHLSYKRLQLQLFYRLAELDPLSLFLFDSKLTSQVNCYS